MFTGIFRTCFSLGAKSQFEKSRLQATYAGDMEEPNEEDLQVILNTLSGKDLETRSQVGFATLISKLEHSDSRGKWNYLLKTLIILDRCVEAKYFLHDISCLNLPYIEKFASEKQNFQTKKIDQMVKEYYKLIKEKAVLYRAQNSGFNVEKKFKKKFFEKREIHDIFIDIKTAQLIHEKSFAISDQGPKSDITFRVVQYVYQSVLQFFLSMYSLQYAAVLVVVERMTQMGLESCMQFERLYQKFLVLSDKTQVFVSEHNEIEGFESIRQQEFYQSDERIGYILKQYMEVLQKQRSSNTDLYKQYRIVSLDSEAIQTPIIVQPSPEQIAARQQLLKPNQQRLEQVPELQSIENSSHKKQEINLSYKRLYNADNEEIDMDFTNNSNLGSAHEKLIQEGSFGQRLQYEQEEDTVKPSDDKYNIDLQQSNLSLNSSLSVSKKLDTVLKKVNSEIVEQGSSPEQSKNFESSGLSQNQPSGRKVKSIQFKEDTPDKSSNGSFIRYRMYTDQPPSSLNVNGVEISYEHLQLGYTTFIQKSSVGSKVSRLDFERTNLQKLILEQEGEGREFNFNFFHHFEEIFSEDENAYRFSHYNNRPSQVMKKNNSDEQLSQYYSKQAAQLAIIQQMENPFQVILENEDSDEEEAQNHQRIFESMSSKKAEVKLDIDWGQYDVFDEQFFNSFEQIYSEDNDSVNINESCTTAASLDVQQQQQNQTSQSSSTDLPVQQNSEIQQQQKQTSAQINNNNKKNNKNKKKWK